MTINTWKTKVKDNLKVFFTNKIDRESTAIEVYVSNNYDLTYNKKDILIATGHLNNCSNWAHIYILEEHEENYSNVENWIVNAIEKREIIHDRILIK